MKKATRLKIVAVQDMTTIQIKKMCNYGTVTIPTISSQNFFPTIFCQFQKAIRCEDLQNKLHKLVSGIIGKY